MLDLFVHCLGVDGEFGELLFGSLEGLGKEGGCVEGGFLLRRLWRESFGAEEVFDWRG